ncbi:MAG: hypothetical protein ABIQ31_13330 [Ferruginibacter sp.]
MDNSNTNTDILIQYLDKELSPEKVLQLEQELRQNVSLKQEFENLLMAKNAVQLYGLQQNIRSLHTGMMDELNLAHATSKPALVRILVRRSMQVAAGLLVVLIGLGVYQYLTISPDKLFRENYQPYQFSVSRSATNTGILEEEYVEKNFPAVIKTFETLSVSDQKQNFIAGQSYLATGAYAKAITCFANVLSLNKPGTSSIFQDDAQYYLALSYLKNNQVALAYPYFELIYNNSNHLYNDKLTSGFMRKLKLLVWKG